MRDYVSLDNRGAYRFIMDDCIFLKIMKAQEIIRSIEAEQLKSNLPQIYVETVSELG